MEEALRCHAVGVVIGELRARDIDQVATRRLSLAAAAGNTFGLILRTAPDDMPSAAATRWIIGAAPSVPARGGERPGVGPPRLVALSYATAVVISEHGSWSGTVWSSVSSSQRILSLWLERFRPTASRGNRMRPAEAGDIRLRPFIVTELE